MMSIVHPNSGTINKSVNKSVMHVDTSSISYTMRYQRIFVTNDWNVIEVQIANM